jgi:tRNA dimethylallyltransferase
VPHHLLDIWDVTRTADVASYQRDARALIETLLAAGRTPILVGGSGLYVRAAIDDLSFPGTDPMVRARLEESLARRGPQALHAELAERAPEAAAAILPSNGRRIVRALEVVELTGEFQATLPDFQAVYDVVQIGLDRDDLDRRIVERVDRMWEGGFVDEVRRLEAQGLRQGRTASRALGYAQLLAWFDGELESVDAARVATATATRRFARRQRSWFRRDPRIIWTHRPDVDWVRRLVLSS